MLSSTIKNPYPNYGKCFMSNCDNPAILKAQFKDDVLVVNVCLCAHCIEMDRVEILRDLKLNGKQNKIERI